MGDPWGLSMGWDGMGDPWGFSMGCDEMGWVTPAPACYCPPGPRASLDHGLPASLAACGAPAAARHAPGAHERDNQLPGPLLPARYCLLVCYSQVRYCLLATACLSATARSATGCSLLPVCLLQPGPLLPARYCLPVCYSHVRYCLLTTACLLLPPPGAADLRICMMHPPARPPATARLQPPATANLHASCASCPPPTA